MKITTFALIGSACALLPLSAYADGDNSSWDGQVAGDPYVASGSATSERVLTDADIRDIISRTGASDTPPEIRYMGGSDIAMDTEYCCGGTKEQYEYVTQTEETTEYIDVVTRRDIVQPVQVRQIQPVTIEVLEGRDEEVYEDRVYETQRMPVRIDRDPTPDVIVNYIEQLTENRTEEVTDEYIDVITQRDIIQPIERTTVVPVRRRITRPRVETLTAEPRYITHTAPEIRNSAIIPETEIHVMEQVETHTERQETHVVVPYVATRNVYQPKTITTIQPVEHQILKPMTETVTEDTRYETSRLETVYNVEPTPHTQETIIPRVTERTILEVEDVYIDQVTRNIIQPVIETTIQPIVTEVVRGIHETETRDTLYRTETLDGMTQTALIPQTVVNYIPQIQEDYREEHTETYFEAVTQRDIYQPVVRTIIQPVVNRHIRGVTETVTNPVRYETVRASLVVLNLGTPCHC